MKRPLRRRSRLRALVLLGLMLASGSPYGSILASVPPGSVGLPSYWVASLMVGSSYYDKDEFRADLSDFYNGIRRDAPGRSVWGRMEAKECRDPEGQRVPRCEVVIIRWNQDNRDLRLLIEEPDGSSGLVDEHQCTTNDTFEICFEHHMKPMIAKVHDHDTHCHVEGRGCILNANEAFEPSPR